LYLIDYEIGIQEEVLSIFVTSIIRGYNFYLGLRVWFGKLQNFSQSKHSKLYIERDTDEIKCLNYIFGFPFLEPDEVKDSFIIDLITNLKPKIK